MFFIIIRSLSRCLLNQNGVIYTILDAGSWWSEKQLRSLCHGTYLKEHGNRFLKTKHARLLCIHVTSKLIKATAPQISKELIQESVRKIYVHMYESEAHVTLKLSQATVPQISRQFIQEPVPNFLLPKC